MTEIRSFTHEDIPAVVALRERLFRLSGWTTTEQRQAYFREVFFENPWACPEISSLVAERDHEVVGFLGLVPRMFRLGGTSLRAAVATQFMVAPESRKGGLAVHLLRTALSGAQDFCITDVANPAAIRVWMRAGGQVAPAYALHWSRALRPAGNAAMSLGQSAAARAVRFAAEPMLDAVDAVGARLGKAPRVPDSGRIEPLSLQILGEHVGSVAGPDSLHAEFDPASFQWVLTQFERKTPEAALHGAIVRGADDIVLGWFIYMLHANRSAQVLQLVSRPDAAQQTVDHLLRHAWSARAIRITGRNQMRAQHSLTRVACTFKEAGPPLCIHSRDNTVCKHVIDGQAVLTGLEGEWWMNF
jgi:predicted N-acetyltransferase YhbS